MRKRVFAFEKSKGADQLGGNAQLISAFVFAT